LKELDITGNKLKILSNFNSTSKLKRLIADQNEIEKFDGSGLVNLEYLSLTHNKLHKFINLNDLQKIVFLDLSQNTIKECSEFGKLKSLRVLDLGDNQIDLPIAEFYSLMLVHIKKNCKIGSRLICWKSN